MTTKQIVSTIWHRLSSTLSVQSRLKLNGKIMRIPFLLQTREYATPTSMTNDDKREKVVVLGSGWAGYVLARKLDPKLYKVLVISPRSYFVFTPLLTESAVGTLEFRNILESVRKTSTKYEFIQGWADDVDFAAKTVTVEPSVMDPEVGHALTGPRKSSELQLEGQHTKLGGTGSNKVITFPISYDKLVIAVGAYSQTFGTKGVRENAMFLKDVGDARRIRRRVLELFELAKLPITPDEMKRYLLHFAIVGGGPTGMEFAASLSDLIEQDMAKMYPDLMKYTKITLYDVAPKVLPMFDASLADYAVKHYKRQNIEIKTSHHVEELRKGSPNDPEAAANQDKEVRGRVYTIRTKEDGDVGIGICIWSTGIMNNPFVSRALNDVRRYPTSSASPVSNSIIHDPSSHKWLIQRDPKTGSILVDDHFRLQLTTQNTSTSSPSSSAAGSSSSPTQAIMNDVFALGDTCKLTNALPATAQVANQQAQWLGRALNRHANNPSAFSSSPGFSFRDLGVMTYLGGSKAILQGPSTSRDESTHRGLRGWVAYLIWRGAYLTMTLSWRNKFLVPVQWLAVKVFGRDVSRF